MRVQDRPSADVTIDDPLVRGLLADQHPDLADLPLGDRFEGWDNVMVRLGDRHVVRLPRREASAELVAHEQSILPILAPRLPLRVPVADRVGVPGRGYPWTWSVVPWIPGDTAASASLDDPIGDARRLGEFLAALHQPAPADAPVNPFRGIPLADRDAMTRERFDRLGDLVDRTRLEAIWRDGLEAPPWTGAPVWLHGDLHPANLIVAGGRLGGVVDWGDLTAGDPATDLAVGWMLFDTAARDVLWHAAGVDRATRTRGRAWAVTLSLAYLAHSADSPVMAAVADRTMRGLQEPHET